MSFKYQNTIAVTRQDWRKTFLLSGVALMVFSLMLATWVSVRAAETVEAGNLNGKALSLPVPEYPPLAKQTRVTGIVKVDVVVSENGKVESAKASSGPMLLKQSAVDAANKAKFAPTLKAGAPVKVSGFLQYEFKLN